jgi:hypothetical protein
VSWADGLRSPLALVQTRWAQLKADASAWTNDIKAKIDKLADQRDAKAAANDADRAGRDAADAIATPSGSCTVRGSRWTHAPPQTSARRSLGLKTWPIARASGVLSVSDWPEGAARPLTALQSLRASPTLSASYDLLLTSDILVGRVDLYRVFRR